MKRTDANPSASLTRLLACAAAISCAATLAGVFSTGCSLDPSGVSSEVPAASILTLPASSTTQREFGVVKWNLDLGQEGLVVTGYDSSGNAVRGLLLAFTAPQPPTQMMVEMLDGTLMAQVLSFGADGAASVAGYLTENQERFVGQALVDIATYESEQAETLGTSSVEQGSAHSGGGLRPLDLVGGLQPLNASPSGSSGCGQQYENDAKNIALGGVACAASAASFDYTAANYLSWGITGEHVLAGHGLLGKIPALPTCLDAASSFFDLGTCGSTSCFQVASACPSCGSGTHLTIDDSTGAGSCAPGDATGSGLCPSGETSVPGPNNKGHTCCKVCGASGSGSSSGTQSLGGGLSIEDIQGSDGCPLAMTSDSGTGTDGGSGGDTGSAAGDDGGSGSGDDGGTTGAGGEGGTCDNNERSAPTP
jgi:hypothetical protein